MVRGIAVALVGFLAACLLTGCGFGGSEPSPTSEAPSPDQSPSSDVGSPSPATSGPSQSAQSKTTLGPDDPVPSFSGPYAAEFERLYRKSASQVQRDVLQDGKIKDQEMSLLEDLHKRCFEAKGYTDISIDDDGTINMQVPEGVDNDQYDADDRECHAPTIGEIGLLYDQIQRNPDAADEQKAMADCLARQGLVEPGYSGADYGRDSPDNYPFDPESKLFKECQQDPFNAGK